MVHQLGKHTTYISTERDYYEHIRQSLFMLTFKKGEGFYFCHRLFSLAVRDPVVIIITGGWDWLAFPH